ncbi:MAG: thioesterase family protein [Dehalococcoidia bacterium]
MPSVFDDKEFSDLVSYFNKIDDERPSFTSFLDFKIESPDFDHPIISFKIRDNLVGNLIFRTLHGGIIASMLDALGGHAIFLQVFKQVRGQQVEKQIKRVSRIGSIDLRIDYVRPGTGSNFTVTGTTLRTGNKIAVIRTELHNEEGKLIAVGTGTYTVG